MIQPKFLLRSDENYHEFSLSYCEKMIEHFKKSRFRKNSKHPAKIYAKVFFPPDCPVQWWMYYLVFEVNGKPYEISSITKEAFDVLTKDIDGACYPSVEFYTIDTHELARA